jgi:predicted enzyme related to lactoylglutathione lyase
MSERDEHGPGVPCWVDTWQSDPATAAAFYADLLGWETERTTTQEAGPEYVVCRLRGRDVAAIGSGADTERADTGAAAPAAWTTYVQVASVDDTVAKAREAGGAIVAPPFDSLDGGRIAILADPAGATFGVWAPGAHRGAQLVNEAGAWAMSVLLCDDSEPAKRFYGATFGWTGDPFPLGDAEATLFRLGGYVGGEPTQPVPRDVVAVMAPAFGRPAGWTINFWVDDADATAAKAPELGGAVLAGPFDTPISRDAVIADPAGAVFSVSTVPAAARQTA